MFQLYLIVPDIDQAAEVLRQSGWTLLTTKPAMIGNALVDKDGQRRLVPLGIAEEILVADKEREEGLIKARISFKADIYSANQTNPLLPPPPPPPCGPPSATETVLLRAPDWNFVFHDVEPLKSEYPLPMPELPAFLDALIGSLLYCLNLHLQHHLQTQIAYLYEYNPEIKTKAFAQQLKYEHQQFHLDALSGMQAWTCPFVDHQRMVRDEILRGTRVVQDCSVDPDHDLFNTEKWGTLRRAFEEKMKKIEQTYKLNQDISDDTLE
jgi:hypothetical protein